MRSPVILASAASLVLLTACGASDGDDPETNSTFDFSYGVPAEHPLGKAGENFAEILNETDQFTIQTYPAGQLHNDVDLVEAIPAGNADIGIINVAQWSGRLPETQIFDVPFAFEDLDAIHAAVDGDAGDLLEDSFEQENTVLLAWLDYEFLHYAGSSSVVDPTDMTNLRVRVPSALAGEAINMVDGAGISMSGSEVYMALERGTVDGAFSGYTSFRDRAYYEVVDQVSEIGLTYAMFALAMNKDDFDGLSQEGQQTILEAATTAAEEHRKQQRQDIEEARAEVQEKGMTVHVPTAEQMETWRTATEQVRDSYSQLADEKGQQILDALDR